MAWHGSELTRSRGGEQFLAAGSLHSLRLLPGLAFLMVQRGSNVGCSLAAVQAFARMSMHLLVLLTPAELAYWLVCTYPTPPLVGTLPGVMKVQWQALQQQQQLQQAHAQKQKRPAGEARAQPS